MKCTICKHGETALGVATVTLTRGDTTVVFKGVPADVCGNCGEHYLDDATARAVFDAAEEAVARGVEIDVRRFRAA
jgi:YgiT-type zinc finger domain-containing protein